MTSKPVRTHLIPNTAVTIYDPHGSIYNYHYFLNNHVGYLLSSAFLASTYKWNEMQWHPLCLPTTGHVHGDSDDICCCTKWELNVASLSIVLHISSSNYNWLIIGVLWLKHTTAKSQFVQFTIVELVWRKYFLLTLVFPLLTSTLGSTFSFSKCSCKFDSSNFFIIRGWEYVLDRAKKRILIKNNKYAWKDRYTLSCV